MLRNIRQVNQLQIGQVSICRNVSTDISFLGANILAKGGQHAPDYPDIQNVEGRAAAHYWKKLFGEESDFIRDRNEDGINSILNYGYAILLAIVARGLVSSGMLPAFGIHHHNKYNPWCLASDIMEPYRPFVDRVVLSILEVNDDPEELTPEIKKLLLQIPVIDIFIDGKSSPLMVGMQRTTASLSSCFEGAVRKIIYPELN